MAELGEAGGRDQADVPGADDAYRFPLHAAEEAIQQQRLAERAMAIITALVAVWSSVFENPVGR